MRFINCKYVKFSLSYRSRHTALDFQKIKIRKLYLYIRASNIDIRNTFIISIFVIESIDSINTKGQTWKCIYHPLIFNDHSFKEPKKNQLSLNLL